MVACVHYFRSFIEHYFSVAAKDGKFFSQAQVTSAPSAFIWWCCRNNGPFYRPLNTIILCSPNFFWQLDCVSFVTVGKWMFAIAKSRFEISSFVACLFIKTMAKIFWSTPINFSYEPPLIMLQTFTEWAYLAICSIITEWTQLICIINALRSTPVKACCWFSFKPITYASLAGVGSNPTLLSILTVGGCKM